MKKLIWLILLGTSLGSCTDEIITHDQSVLDKLLIQEDVEEYILNHNNTLVISKSGYCLTNDCEKLFRHLNTDVQINIYSKEEMFMRNILNESVEILELNPGYLKARVQHPDNVRTFEIWGN